MNAPDQYGVVGHPISHSWSPFIHGLFAKQTDQSLVYRLYDIAPGGLPRAGAGILHARRPRAERDRTTQGSGGRAGQRAHRARRPGRRGQHADDQRRAQPARRQHRRPRAGHRPAQEPRPHHHQRAHPDPRRRRRHARRGRAAARRSGPPSWSSPTARPTARSISPRCSPISAPVRGCGFEDVGDEPFDIVINATAAGLTGVGAQRGRRRHRQPHGLLRHELQQVGDAFRDLGH